MRVNRGSLAGKTLPEVQEALGVDLVGTRNQGMLDLGRFPLLIKLLDANRWLSVQVHPDDAYGLANEEDLGKTEMWVVLYAKPDAELDLWLQARREQGCLCRTPSMSGTVDEWLHRVPVQAGDVIFVPAGTIHALGPGTIVAEIQQNSNTTYRIYDWGRPRPIHLAQALDVLNFELIEPGPLTPVLLEANGVRREQIGQCAYFETERLALPAGSAFSGTCDGSTFEIWAALEGEADHFLGRRAGVACRRGLGLAAGGIGRFSSYRTRRECSAPSIDAGVVAARANRGCSGRSTGGLFLSGQPAMEMP